MTYWLQLGGMVVAVPVLIAIGVLAGNLVCRGVVYLWRRYGLLALGAFLANCVIAWSALYGILQGRSLWWLVGAVTTIFTIRCLAHLGYELAEENERVVAGVRERPVMPWEADEKVPQRKADECWVCGIYKERGIKGKCAQHEEN